MKLPLESYRTLVFDCDGVILNSNRIKTDAFYNVALAYGKIAAEALVEYHVQNGGISRYMKFTHFLEKIVPVGAKGPSRVELLKSFADLVRQGLLTCDIAEGLAALRKKTGHARWLVVSGGDQVELRDIFEQRKLAGYFDRGIYGSPDTKDVILAREFKAGGVSFPALFLGDSKYDYDAAMGANIDFVYLSAWSESQELLDLSVEKKISSLKAIADF